MNPKIIILILVFAFSLTFCKKETENNKLPICAILNPVNDTTIWKNDVVQITFDAADEDGDLTQVNLYFNEVLVKEFKERPYNYEWDTKENELGNYKIKITAIDDNNDLSEDEIAINLIEGSVIDFDGNEYKAVKIGDQWWMAENLKTTHYADGTEIPFVESDSAWSMLDYEKDTHPYSLQYEDKAYCYYENSEDNLNVFGVLYNWMAAMNGTESSSSIPSNVQGVCPDGWHLPSDEEWIKMERYLGISENHILAEGLGRGENIGNILAGEIELWEVGDLVNDTLFGELGFNAIPSGIRYFGDVAYEKLNQECYLWSSSELYSFAAIHRTIRYNSTGIDRTSNLKNVGASVRCIKN